jgi:hypothetical protein
MSFFCHCHFKSHIRSWVVVVSDIWANLIAHPEGGDKIVHCQELEMLNCARNNLLQAVSRLKFKLSAF